MRKSCPRASYPKRRPQICSRCNFHLLTYFLSRSESVSDSSMAAPLSSRSSIPQSIRSHLCTNGLLLLLIVYAWLRPESVMVAVKYLVLIGQGTFLTTSLFPQASPVMCTPNVCRKYRQSHVQLCLHLFCAWRLSKR